MKAKQDNSDQVLIIWGCIFLLIFIVGYFSHEFNLTLQAYKNCKFVQQVGHIDNLDYVLLKCSPEDATKLQDGL